MAFSVKKAVRLAGYTILEILLVIAVISALAIITTRLFRATTAQTEMALAQQDITNALLALDQFYHQQRCIKGQLPASVVQVDIFPQLTLLEVPLSQTMKKPAWLGTINAFIIPTASTTRDHRVIYTLRLQAELNLTSSGQAARAATLAGLLQATLQPPATLQWNQMPSVGTRNWQVNQTGLAAAKNYLNQVVSDPTNTSVGLTDNGCAN